MLEDEVSREIYLNRLNYLVSGEFSFIEKIVRAYIPELPPFGDKTIEEVVSDLPKDRDFVLFGAGELGAAVRDIFCGDPRFLGFCSSTVEKQKRGFQGCPVMSPEELIRRKDISVIVSALTAKSEILTILRQGKYPEELIFTLSGLNVSNNDQYFGPDFISYEAEEVFVDAGSFDLCSSIALREHGAKIKKVYAFEPDQKNCELCEENKKKYHFSEAEILPYGTWSESTTLAFHTNEEAASSSRISEHGSVYVPVKAIDEVVDRNERVTFIKMDVEGAELESLKGAKDTIQKDKPKLAICIYHKPEDMTEIPLYIQSLVPEYKFYIRHHSNYSCETVLYAIMP